MSWAENGEAKGLNVDVVGMTLGGLPRTVLGAQAEVQMAQSRPRSVGGHCRRPWATP